MRKSGALGAAFAILGAGTAAVATVPPPTPGQLMMMEKRQALETHARNSFSDIGLIEKLRDWRKHWGFILVGKEGSTAAPRLLIKDEYGWYEMRRGQTRRLPLRIGHELNRVLGREEVWQEEPFNLGQPCRGRPRLFVVMHAGRDTFGRLGCGPEGLAARAALIAEKLRIPSGPARSTARVGHEPPPPGVPLEMHEAGREISAKLFEMAAARERKTLAGFVEPYAEDAVVELPEGTIRGRKAIIDWARRLQDWDGPYSAERFVMHQATMPAQQGADRFYETHEFRWEQGGQPVRQTFSTLWRYIDGQWLIAHERVSEVKPVTERRPVGGS